MIDPIRERLEAYTHKVLPNEPGNIAEKEIEKCKTDLLHFSKNFIKDQESLPNEFQKVLIDNLDKLYVEK